MIPNSCEDEEVVPQKTYFGGQQGVGEFTWCKVKNKLDESALMDLPNACDVVVCSETL